MSSFIKKNWFLISVAVIIVLAKINPEIGAHGGPLRPEVTVKIGCVAGIFFASGVTIQSRSFTLAILQARLTYLGFKFLV